MKLSQLAHRIGFLLSAPKCVACGERLSLDDRALCKVCYCELLDNMTRNCSRCSNTLSKCTCSNEYLISHKVRHVVKVYRYIRREENRASNHLVYSLKKDNRKDVLDLCADLLQGSINSTLIDGGIIKDKSAVVVTNVPRRKAAFVKFGIDHYLQTHRVPEVRLALTILRSWRKRFQIDLSSNINPCSSQRQRKPRRN